MCKGFAVLKCAFVSLKGHFHLLCSAADTSGPPLHPHGDAGARHSGGSALSDCW